MNPTPKQALRTAMRRRRRQLSAHTQHHHARRFRDNLIRTQTYRRARSVAYYWPVNGELDTRPAIEHALTSGRRVYLPVVDRDRMWFARWHGERLPVSRTARLPQPLKRASRLMNVRLLDLVVVPLVAFTATGARLGQGGGYYDRLFAFHRRQSWRRPVLLGAAHHQQQTDHIPVDPWDVSLSGIITDHNIVLNTYRGTPR